MILKESVYLATRNSRGKVQTVLAECYQDGNSFIIERNTGQLDGKITPQPVITITEGKAKRSPLEQANLEFNSIIKKYCDKGYKKLSDLTKKKISELKSSDIEKLVPEDKTDANGVKKVMLAKDSNKCAISCFEKSWRCSRKLDGVRCQMFFKDGEVKTASRGGGDYDVSTTHLRETPAIVEFFEKHPNVVLDGELYSHGRSLQSLSGTARLKEWEERCRVLEYWIYDISDDTKIFNDRLDFLAKNRSQLQSDGNVVVIEHVLLESYSKIKAQHDKWVQEGYEGLVMRNPQKTYGYGKRSSDMIKLKDYTDGEFKITGISEGLRDEDMCFTLVTSKGKEFKAKPMGSRELKDEYLENMEEIIGKMATVKYFAFSEDGVPMQPVLKSIRGYGE